MIVSRRNTSIGRREPGNAGQTGTAADGDGRAAGAAEGAPGGARSALLVDAQERGQFSGHRTLPEPRSRISRLRNGRGVGQQQQHGHERLHRRTARTQHGARGRMIALTFSLIT